MKTVNALIAKAYKLRIEKLFNAEDPIVTTKDYWYLVLYGEDVHEGNRKHNVNKNKKCDCELGTECPAVSKVQKYLNLGGIQAPKRKYGVFLIPPAECPIDGCGSKTRRHPIRSRPKNGGIRWECDEGGYIHYLKACANDTARYKLENKDKIAESKKVDEAAYQADLKAKFKFFFPE